MFETVDFVVAPTVPDARRSAVEQRFVEWPSGRSESVNSAYVRLCMAGNVTGFPAISLPCGLSGEGLPIGVQVLAGPHRDLGLLASPPCSRPTSTTSGGRPGSSGALGPAHQPSSRRRASPMPKW